MLIETQIKGRRRDFIVQEWLTNSSHFPLANIILELLLTGFPQYLHEIGLYALLTGSLVQAWFLGSWQFAERPRPLVGNLIGPAIYTLVEVAAEGMSFFDDPYHWAYWVFALAIGGLQQGRLAARRETPLILLENLVRTNILLATYWMLESATSPSGTHATGFLKDEAHLFLVVVISLLGLVVGLANATSSRFLARLRETADRLKNYSEWLLGKEILAQAVQNPALLALQRRERALLFLDIRGFTAWSEDRSPEAVVAMLNQSFELAETLWQERAPIKAKFTGDEIMLVFHTAREAFDTAQILRNELGRFLADHGLSCGIGLHCGPLVEGLLGSRQVKGYDVIGDTVNTAKRICDHAKGGEILASGEFLAALGTPPEAPARRLDLKGKANPFAVYPVSRSLSDLG
jgi:adenylate cyclase